VSDGDNEVFIDVFYVGKYGMAPDRVDVRMNHIDTTIDDTL
jgi:hypothetical protein